ncbi:MAG: hypothetical protein LBE74_02795 [Treponema sp.]|nr:hypothetical protein [Treponema sp.]
MPLSAQNQSFALGRLSFFLSPKVLKDGSITDASLGFQYTPNSGGILRVRYSNRANNDQFDETVPDSLVAASTESVEVFLTPFEYAFLNRPSAQIKRRLCVRRLREPYVREPACGATVYWRYLS